MNARYRFPICLVILFSFSILDLYSQDEKLKNPPLKSDVETVYLKISIADPVSRSVTGLKKENFKVFEDKVEQEIVYFDQKEAPMSVGMILDTSPSMKESEYWEGTKKTISRFLKYAEPQDELFLIVFNEKTGLIKDLKKQPLSEDDNAVFESGGNTALYDALYWGLDQIRNCRNDSKALILISDGKDNSSKYSPREVLEFAKQSDVQIYWIGQQDDRGYPNANIREMVKTTGGREFYPNSYRELDYYIKLVQSTLYNQYVLGYNSTNQARDGKWRRIKVELNAPKLLPKLKVHVREGYYAHKY